MTKIILSILEYIYLKLHKKGINCVAFGKLTWLMTQQINNYLWNLVLGVYKGRLSFETSSQGTQFTFRDLCVVLYNRI